MLSNGEEAPNGYQFVNCHMMSDIKMDDFRRMACLVEGDDVTQMLEFIIYTSVVTREAVCIALPMAALHNQEVKAVAVLNTCDGTQLRKDMGSARSRVWG